MPKKPNERLFRLAKSLTGPEKRYFMIYIKSYGKRGPKYADLFHLLLKQEEYNEAEIKLVIYGDVSLNSMKFSELKNYLYNLILEALGRFHGGKSVDYAIKNHIQNCRILYQRSLYPEASAELVKGRKIATKFGRQLALMEIVQWEMQLARTEANLLVMEKHGPIWDARLVEHQNVLGHETEAWQLFFELLVLSRKEALLREEKQIKELRARLSAFKLKYVSGFPSVKTELLYHRIYSFFHYLASEFRIESTSHQGRCCRLYFFSQ